MNFEEIKRQAEDELRHELFRDKVEAYKNKLRKQKWWHKLFPWKVLIIRRDK